MSQNHRRNAAAIDPTKQSSLFEGLSSESAASTHASPDRLGAANE
jgi:hypothetical protein